MTEQKKAKAVASLRASGTTLEQLEATARELKAFSDDLRSRGQDEAADAIAGGALASIAMYRLLAEAEAA